MTVPDLLPVRMLNELVYCPRLFHLEWVGREWAPNVYTADGDYQHRRVDTPGGSIPGPGVEDDEMVSKARSVDMSAPGEGLIAKMDVVESDGRSATPVDVKRGRRPDIPAGVWAPERIQIGAQALILRENGYRVDRGVVWFAASRQQVEILIDDSLVEETRDAAKRAREVAAVAEPPPPLVDSPKCRKCSLAPICLPDEVNQLRIGAGLTHAERSRPRTIAVRRDDAKPLYVQRHAARLGKNRDRLKVTFKGETLGEARMREVSQVVLMGNIGLSAQATKALCNAEIPVLHFSYGGWYYGTTRGHDHKNIERRIRQFEAAGDPDRALEVARRLVSAKVRNSRVLLRRNGDADDGVLKEMKRLAKQASKTKTLASLLGVEGMAARHYFQSFSTMLKSQSDIRDFIFEKRNRRPPTDPNNACLSYGYGLLTKDLTVVSASVGFDPYLGFLHQPRYGRPALALDLMEPFRPLVVDSVVITAINNGELKPHHFITRAGATAFSQAGRKAFLAAYERRMGAEVTHPLFQYRLSYRRLLELQTRLLDRYLIGELDHYPAFVVR